MVNDIRDDHPDVLSPFVLQADRDIVGFVVIQFSKCLDLLLCFTAYLFAVLERFRYGRNGNIQFPGDVFECYFSFHRIEKYLENVAERYDNQP